MSEGTPWSNNVLKFTCWLLRLTKPHGVRDERREVVCLTAKQGVCIQGCQWVRLTNGAMISKEYLGVNAADFEILLLKLLVDNPVDFLDKEVSSNCGNEMVEQCPVPLALVFRRMLWMSKSSAPEEVIPKTDMTS